MHMVLIRHNLLGNLLMHDVSRPSGMLHRYFTQSAVLHSKFGRGHWLCHLCLVPTPFCKCVDCIYYHLTHSTVPELSPLPHQMLQGLYAFQDEASRKRIPENPESDKDRSRDDGTKNCQVCVVLLYHPPMG